MIENHLSGVPNVTIGPLISFLIFMALFTGASIYAFTRSKPFIRHMSTLPLEEEQEDGMKG